MTQLRTGIPAAPITLPDLDGHTVTVDPLRPGPKVLVFYKADCPTCQFGLPIYDRLYRAFEDSAVAVYAVAQNSPAVARAFAREYDVRMPQLIDGPPYAASRVYHILNVPTMVVIDEGGRVAIVSPAFIKDDIHRTAILLAEAAGRPGPELFAPGEEVPALRPG